MKIAYIFVISDFLHYGILKFIKEVKKQSDYLICGVLTDDAASKIKKEKPLNSFSERLEVLSSIQYIDEVIKQKEFNPFNNLKQLTNQYKEVTFYYGENIYKKLNINSLKKLSIQFEEISYENNYSDKNIAKKLYLSSFLKNNIDSFANFNTNNFLTFDTKNTKNVFSTKAGTLKNFSSILQKSKIEKSFVFTVINYIEYKEKIISYINKNFKQVIIRSSALNEDTKNESKAGFYDSVLNVNSQNKKEIEEAIKTVITSYKKSKHEHLYNEILVQTQTKNILINGVIFTNDIQTNLPYYVINYTSGNTTDIVTSGKGLTQTKFIHKNVRIKKLSNIYKVLIKAIIEIESLIKEVPLDIEFAVTNNFKVIIFQVRPLVKCNPIGIKESKNNLKLAYKNLGKNILLSDMAFWNPAELIGDNPRYLANSLFETIIMNKSWNDGLIDIGYPKIKGKLQQNILNKPYIDINKSYKALTIKSIDKKIKEKLFTYYSNKLDQNKHFHDKIEFDIIFSHYLPNFNSYKKELLEAGLSTKEFKNLNTTLLNFTTNLINDYSNIQTNYRKKLTQLIYKQKIYKNSEISLLISDCKEFGVVPFSTAARIAFISKNIFYSFRKKGLISLSELNIIESSFKTISSELNDDISNLHKKQISLSYFNNKYGHLRTGTYDITSKPYKEIILSNGIKEELTSPNQDLSLIKNKINKFFIDNDININFDNLYYMYKNSMYDREYIKLIYTKNISFILNKLSKIARQKNISLDLISHLDINNLNKLNLDNNSLKKYLKKQKNKFLKRSLIKLPSIIFSKEELGDFNILTSQINFIGTKNIKAETILLNNNSTNININNKIVLIENADPGYHWIFTKNIKGLVTKYGGVASHMTICCNEFGISAAIGCGEKFEELKKMSSLSIKPKEKIIF